MHRAFVHAHITIYQHYITAEEENLPQQHVMRVLVTVASSTIKFHYANQTQKIPAYEIWWHASRKTLLSYDDIQQGEGTSLKFTFLLKHMSIIINYCSLSGDLPQPQWAAYKFAWSYNPNLRADNYTFHRHIHETEQYSSQFGRGLSVSTSYSLINSLALFPHIHIYIHVFSLYAPYTYIHTCRRTQSTSPSMHGSMQNECWHGSSLGLRYLSRQTQQVRSCSNCSIFQAAR